MSQNAALRQERFERACWWLERGVEIVPLKPCSKHLQPGYGARQARITSVDFARKWFLNTNANLGIVLGGSTGLAVADWDSLEDYRSWRRGLGRDIDTLVEQTARGYHLFFVDVHWPSSQGGGCELKTSGVCMVAPSVHPSGLLYRIVQKVPITGLAEDKVQLLFPFLSELLFSHGVSDIGDPLPSRGERRDAYLSLVQRIKAVRSIVAELEAAGVKDWQRSGNNLVARCVFHADASPSLWVNPASGLWGCNASSCPAHDGRHAHDVINARALRFGLSNSEAIQQLADEFLSPG